MGKILWGIAVFGWIVLAVMYARGEPPVRLVGKEEERELNAMLPVVGDSSFIATKVCNSDDLIWYTDREMPPAYQVQNTFHSPFYNISNDNERDLSGRVIGKDRTGNGNRDFPWVATAGTDQSANVEIFRFIKFPRDDSGKVLPMVYYNSPNPGSGLRAFNGAVTTLGEGGGPDSSQRWWYPKGTIVGELMTMHGPDDRLYPFELRLRERQKDFWEVDVIRPYPAANDLEVAVKELRPEWMFDDSLVTLVVSLDNPKIESGSIRDANRNVMAFGANFKKHVLPPIKDPKLVAELLTTASWKTAQGIEWVKGVTCPTVPKGTAFHIVPEEYSAHIVAVDSESCRNCHKHTGFNVRTFDANRGWYGRVRGNDEIFTHHPINPASISYDGNNRDVAFRSEYVKAGLVERYDGRKHKSNYYGALKQ